MKRVFIDGQEGTTGLKISSRLQAREDIEILVIDKELRKNMAARLDCINRADVTFLCLPDYASKEIAALAPKDKKIIDASTAHRTDEAWVYGFPEIDGLRREQIRNSCRVSVPGCHASGFIAIVKPLVDLRLIGEEALLACTSITGYSGGGKTMIHEYENNQNADGTEKIAGLFSPGIYGLTQNHKHLPEMKKITGLKNGPAFLPIVSNYYSGMLVTVPLDQELLKKKISLQELEQLYRNYYENQKMLRVVGLAEQENKGILYANRLADRDDMEIMVHGNDHKPVISAIYDNLGKGASGAAIQCMNIMLGIEETTSLVKGSSHEKEY